MRASAAAAATVSALGLSLTVVSHAWAASDCQIAFEKWAVLSSSRVRTVAQGGSGGGSGACVASEAVRRSLLAALEHTRALCGGSASDPSLQQTYTLLNINHSFISSLGLCRSDSVDAGEGWLTKSAPVPESPTPPVAAPVARAKPAAVAPSPSPHGGGPRPAAVTPPSKPVTVGSRPVVSARPPPPPKPAAAPAAPPPKPPCLQMSASAEAGSFAFVNGRCRGYTVLAVIETRGTSGTTTCRGYEISRSLAVRAPGNAPPRLNYECVTSKRSCNKERLGDMFPECDW